MPKYKIEIEGDIELMRQITEAMELQLRLQMNQTDEVFRVWENAVYETATLENISVGGVPKISLNLLGVERDKDNHRLTALYHLRDQLRPHFEQIENIWRGVFGELQILNRLSPHRSRRQDRAYKVWKGLEHRLLHLLSPKEAEPLIKHTAHYDTPDAVSGKSDITVRLTVVEEL